MKWPLSYLVFFTCRTSWLEARIISFRAGGGILIPSLKAMDIMAAWRKKKRNKSEETDKKNLQHALFPSGGNDKQTL